MQIKQPEVGKQANELHTSLKT